MIYANKNAFLRRYYPVQVLRVPWFSVTRISAKAPLANSGYPLPILYLPNTDFK